MSRITTPETIETAPEASRPLLEAVKNQLGSVPNLFRLTANSPAALEGYLGLNAALGKGVLASPIREQIALAVAELNGCNYCLAAHTYLGRNVAKLSDDEIDAAREARSSDAKADAAVQFAAEIVQRRGHVRAASVDAVRAAGFSDADIVEIVAHVALNTLTNYVNTVGGTEIDFPAVRASRNGAEQA
ncbi:MAG: carboxymuconolactone decarboxylase family protein [Alphaproteobacteria bacterium]|nr:carboxymuconolactone decarboxylase family protein [Alphaproteobacteria bacterium]